MLASSAFVLAALTMTGVYMKGQNVESEDDGYTLDFTALENNADDKLQEITENNDSSFAISGKYSAHVAVSSEMENPSGPTPN